MRLLSILQLSSLRAPLYNLATMHSEAGNTVRSSGIQERTWQTKDKLERYSLVNKDIQRMGLTWEEVEASAQDRQRVALCIGDAR